MIKPPEKIDGAKVLYWAWSGDIPFGWVGTESDSVPIYGLVIAQYEGGSVIYRFSCNQSWETEQDADYASIEDALKNLPEQYKRAAAKWHEF